MDTTTRPSVLKDAMAACRSALVTVGIFSFCINLLILTVPVFMVQVFDRVMTSHNQDTLAVLVIAALMALCIMAALDVVRSRILVRIGLWLDRKLAPELFAATIGASAAGEERSSQRIRDLAQVRNFLTGAGIFALLDAPWVPLFIGLIFFLHPVLGTVALLGAIGLFSLALINDVATRAPLKIANTAVLTSYNAAESMVRQGETAEGLGMVSVLSDWWCRNNHGALKLQAQASDRAGLIMALTKWLRLSLQILVLGLAADLVLGQEITVGAMLAASVILSRALSPVEKSVGLWRGLLDTRAAFQRIRHTMAFAERMPPVQSLPKPQGKLSAEKVAFLPAGADDPLFADVSFDVAPGQILGITGPSGIGKSTLVRLLIGVTKPSHGKVRLDGADLTTWRSDDRGRHIGFVPQIVELFPGTVMQNIARFTDGPAEKVYEAARRAGIHERIMRLPSGYETRVGGPGDLLSAGMRQRVALARAIYGDPAYVVLDEPYSNLDMEGAQCLVTALNDLRARGATVIIVAHRPSILAQADRVLMMDEGGAEIIERRNQANLTVLPGSEKPAGGRGAKAAAKSKRAEG